MSTSSTKRVASWNSQSESQKLIKSDVVSNFPPSHISVSNRVRSEYAITTLLAAWLAHRTPIKVAFLLTNLKPDFAIENQISSSIYEQTNLRLQSTSERGSFGLVTETSFRFSFHLREFGLDCILRLLSSAQNKYGESNIRGTVLST